MGRYEQLVELVAERHDLRLQVDAALLPAHYSAAVEGHDGDDVWTLKVCGEESTETACEALYGALLERSDRMWAPDCCLGVRLTPSENGGLCGCTGCGEPDLSDRSASDYAVSIAAARSLK